MAEETGKRRTAVRAYARAAGVLFFVSIVAGGFGEGYAPGQLIVAGDAAATLANLQAHETLHRLSFAAYLAEGLADTALAALFYVLLEPVSRGLALIAAFMGLMSAALYAVCELFYFALPHLVATGALGAFPPAEAAALVLLSLKLFNYGAGMFLIFYGAAWIIRGALMIASGYFPKLLGGLMILGGLGFVARTLTAVLAPQYSSNLMLMLLIPGGVLLGLWLVARGVDPDKWHARLVSGRE
ncbi:MAG TPA: DUF4386 domain-containing protein [Rhizomicrobium sp.]|nr:DUF4386 domain-containing protein [Rhizomicrobium sp.]